MFTNECYFKIALRNPEKIALSVSGDMSNAVTNRREKPNSQPSENNIEQLSGYSSVFVD
jgi:hypothetical protein